MKKMFLTLVAAAAVIAAPAISDAQPAFHPTAARGGFHGAHFDNRASAELNGRIGNLETRIGIGRRTGSLSFREAARLSGKLNEVTALKRSFERSGRGLSGQEVAMLNAKLDALSGQVRVQAHDYNRR